MLTQDFPEMLLPWVSTVTMTTLIDIIYSVFVLVKANSKHEKKVSLEVLIFNFFIGIFNVEFR